MFKAPFLSLSMGREGMGYVRNAAVVWWLLVRMMVLCYTLREKLHKGSQGMISQTLLAMLITTKVEGSTKTGKNIEDTRAAGLPHSRHFLAEKCIHLSDLGLSVFLGGCLRKAGTEHG